MLNEHIEELRPCPFCNSEIFNHFGTKAIMHKQGCPMLNGTTEHIKILSRCELEAWNTRPTEPQQVDVSEAIKEINNIRATIAGYEMAGTPLSSEMIDYWKEKLYSIELIINNGTLQQVKQGSEWVSAIDTVIEIVTILSFNETELHKFNYQGFRNILIELKENLPPQPPTNTEEEG